MILGFLSRCPFVPSGSDPQPPGDLIPDVGFDNPSVWVTNGGATVAGSQITSADDSGVAPTEVTLAAVLTPGVSYRLLAQVESNLGGAFQVRVWNRDGSQLIGTYNDAAQLIDTSFVAVAAYTSLRISWFEFSIRLSSTSLQPVA